MKRNLLIFLLFLSGSISAQSTYRVESFSPQGTIKEPKQVTVRFNQDMVNFGDPREKKSLFDSNCEELGTSRWIDSKNWVFDFFSPLESGNICKFTIRNDIKSLSGGSLSGNGSFEFSTGGINIQYSSPWSSSTVVEDQVFLFKLDGDLDEKSAIEKAYFLSDSFADKIYVKQITGSQLDSIIQAAYWNQVDKNRIIALAPKLELPSNSNIQFVWSKDIQSKSGVKTGTDQLFNFKVRPKFQASFHCERENAQKHCIPFSAMEVRFSAPLDVKFRDGISLVDSKGKRYKPALRDYDKNTNSFQSLSFEGPFPEKSNFEIQINSGTMDDAGRKLSNIGSFPLKVKTDAYPPLAKFSSTFGILESKASPILPVTIRNLDSTVTGKIMSLNGDSINSENVSKWMSSVHSHKREKSVFAGSQDKINNLQVPKLSQDGSMEVVGIPLLKPGFYVVELNSRFLGKSLLDANADMYVPSIALVTNMSVHFKWGRENSLVWVTELASGKPVADAQISISDCKGKIYARGKTFQDGTYRVPKLPDKSDIPYCSWNSYHNGLFVFASSGGDVSFVHSNWNQGIETWRYNLPYARYRSEQIVHTVLDRSLLKAGDTLHLKHYVRKHSSKGFISPDLNTVPNYIMIKHEGTEELYFHKVNWSFPGHADSSWKIPKSAYLGNYSVYLANSDKDKWGLEKLAEFRVEEFRLPVLQASISSKQSTYINEEKIPITLQAKYLAGGAASKLPVKVRHRIYPSSFSPNGWNEFIFSSPKTKTGRISNQPSEASSTGFTTTELVLDKDGLGSHTIVWKENNEEVSTASIEMEFRDPNGEVQSVSSRINLLPSSQFVGIKTDSYSMNSDDIKIATSVVNSQGKPINESSVEVWAYKLENFTHRKRLVGGFYSYEYYSEIKSLGRICSGNTNSQGIYICNKKDFSESGNIIFEARNKNSDGKITYASNQVWLSGKDDWWYTASDHDRMDIDLDKVHYKVGDKAKIHIQSPFSEFTALITIEREGIIKTYVRNVDGKNPYVEIPIEKEFTPNVFVSVVAVRGRVGSPKETALVDLAKPSFRVGMKEMKVGWDPHRLTVDINTDKKEYQIRSQAKIDIKVETFDKKAVSTGGEVAIGIVDEALLELSDNKTVDLLSAMMATRGLEVDSYSAQLQIVGKRHFGKKAVPAGGGGGKQPTRELLDTLLYWNPSVKLDNKGTASITIPVKDNLTSYRIVAVATSGVGLFGTGTTGFSATQDILLFSGLPPVIRTKDKFFQEYTLKNTTKSSYSLEAKLIADGSNGKEDFPIQTISLKPGESKRIGWEVNVGEKVGVRNSTIEIKNSGKIIDSLKVNQKIEASVPVRVVQGTLFQLGGKAEIPIALPKDGLDGSGRIDIQLDSTVLKSMDSIKSYMEIYPYTCMEQKVSKAIVSENSKEIQAVIGELSGHLDGDGLVKYFPNSIWGSEMLTSYVLSISNEAGWKLPPSLVDSMTTGLNRYLDGTLIRQNQTNFSDGVIRRLQIIESLSRYNSSSGNRIDELAIDSKLLPTSSLLDIVSILSRISGSSKRDALRKEAEDNLRSRLNLQGREMVINDSSGDLWWLMGSLDQDSARFLSYAVDNSLYKPDLGRMAIGFMNRMKDGRFRTTLANSYGYLSMKKFAKTQEKDQVLGNTDINLLSMKRAISWKGTPRESFGMEFPMNQEREGKLKLEHSGSGNPWVSVYAKSAVPIKNNWDNGMRIRKSVTAIERKSIGKWSVGDIVKVRIDWELDASRTWVVINDPIPTGATILGSGLGRDSSLAGEGKIQTMDYNTTFQERGFSGFRSYYEYLPSGKYSLEYSFRINQEGRFILPPTRGEAMYSPDIFGESPNLEWIIVP